MRGYSKIKEGNLFSQRSKSKKDFPFLDQDFDGSHDDNIYSSNTTTKNPLENEQKPKNDEDFAKKEDFFLGKKSDEYNHQDYKQDHDEKERHQQHVIKNGGEKKIGAVLKRNLTVSSSTTSTFTYQKTSKSNNNNNQLERQSSTRAIQEAVKRAFSMRRSSSVNSERYCRIYDQSLHVQDFDNCDYVYDDCNNGNHNHLDDEFEIRTGSSMEETRSMSMNKKKIKNNGNKATINNNNGKMHVGSKVARACRRLFSR